MKQLVRELGINVAGGLISGGALFAVGFWSGRLQLNSLRTVAITVFVVLAAASVSMAIWVYRARTRSTIEPNATIARFGKTPRRIAGGVAVAAILFAGGSFFVLQDPVPFSIPVLVIRVSNESTASVTIDERAEFSLLVGARMGIGQTVAAGQLDLRPVDGTSPDYVTVPAGTKVLVAGEFRNQAAYQRLLDAGSTDLEVHIYEAGGGLIINQEAFRFDRATLIKYRLDVTTE